MAKKCWPFILSLLTLNVPGPAWIRKQYWEQKMCVSSVNSEDVLAWIRCRISLVWNDLLYGKKLAVDCRATAFSPAGTQHWITIPRLVACASRAVFPETWLLWICPLKNAEDHASPQAVTEPGCTSRQHSATSWTWNCFETWTLNILLESRKKIFAYSRYPSSSFWFKKWQLLLSCALGNVIGTRPD